MSVDNPQPTMRIGPWPQPSPIDPQRLAAAVLHPDPADVRDFNRHVGSRYLKTVLFGWPRAIRHAVRHPGVELLDDAAFCALARDTSMSRLLCPRLDPPDHDRFAEVLAETPKRARLFKIDLSAMEALDNFPGLYSAGSVTLIERGDGDALHLRAIALGDLVLRPSDGRSWELAKVFVLQGASQHMITSAHYPLHFPLDSVNAVTRTLLPEDHPVRQALEPHFRFSLGLNNAALYSAGSVLRNQPAHPWAPFASTGASIYEMVTVGYTGIEGNSAYPRYAFPGGPLSGDLPFDRFRRGYYEIFEEFSAAIVGALPGAASLSPWADHIAPWVPGFPGGERIAEPAVATRALAQILAAISIFHAVEHHSFGNVPINRIPLRLRVPPPSRGGVPGWTPATLCTRVDLMRHYLAWEMFIREHTVTRLIDTRYRFDSPELQGAAARMRRRLEDYDANLDTVRYIPLDRISASLQF